MDTNSILPQVKAVGGDSDHSLTSVEVKNWWRYAFTPPYTFIGSRETT